MPRIPIVHADDVCVKVPVLECYKTVGSCVRCVFILGSQLSFKLAVCSRHVDERTADA